MGDDYIPCMTNADLEIIIRNNMAHFYVDGELAFAMKHEHLAVFKDEVNWAWNEIMSND